MSDLIETATIEQQLLDKIKQTLSSIDKDIKKSSSELETLYHVSNKVLLSQWSLILNSDLSCEEKKSALKKSLADRWQDIKNSDEAYCEQPRGQLNQLCWSLALYIAPLPEDLSECDNWQVGEGPYFILMPDLDACEDIILGTNIHQYRLHEFVLSEDCKRFIPIYDTLNYYLEGTSKKPLHMVFTQEQMENNLVDMRNDLLTEPECTKLSEHSELTKSVMQSMEILKNPEASFFNRLSKFADGLFAGSSHGGAGKGNNAAAQANEAIVEFFAYWDALPQEMRQLYLNKVPQLGPILKRMSDPVSIASQGVVYCVGVTASDLRHVVSQNKDILQGNDLNKLQGGVKKLLQQLEKGLQKANYTLISTKKNSIPLPSNVMALPSKEQQAIIKTYLKLDYPNFLYYVLDHQPLLIKNAIAAFNRSALKAEIFKERSKQGISLLMTLLQSKPEQMAAFLATCIQLDDSLWYEEFKLRSHAGDSLILMTLREQPELLEQLFSVIERLDRNSQLQILQQQDKTFGSLLIRILQNNVAAFIQLSKMLTQFNAKAIAQLLTPQNEAGDTLLTLAFREHPNAISVLMPLLAKCDTKALIPLIRHQNTIGFSVAELALTAAPEHFKMIISVIKHFSSEDIHALFLSCKAPSDCLLLKAAYASVDNFNQVLSLLDECLENNYSEGLTALDSISNNLLLIVMLHQAIPSVALFEQLALQPKETLYSILSQRNKEGFTPLTLALTSAPQYYLPLLELIQTLSPKAQKTLFSQKNINDKHLPLLAALKSPKLLPSVMENCDSLIITKSFCQTSLCKQGLLQLTMTHRPDYFPNLVAILKSQSLAVRFSTLNQNDHQGNNVIASLLEAPNFSLEYLFELLDGLSFELQLELFSHTNHKGMHALTVTYQASPSRLKSLFDEKNSLMDKTVIEALSSASWFDLLSISSSSPVDFERYYVRFKKIVKNNKHAWQQLLSCLDCHDNNLLMIVIYNNPDMSRQILRDAKEFLNERQLRQLLVQRNCYSVDLLSLAERIMPDDFLVNLQVLVKRVDKNYAKKMTASASMKMHSADVLISSETLEHCNATQLMTKLKEVDTAGNNLLGQIILRMPYRLPALIKKIKKLLSADDIKQLLLHQNLNDEQVYLIALRQPQASFLCDHLQTLLTYFESDTCMEMLLTPGGAHGLINTALHNQPLAFMSLMQLIDRFDEANRDNILNDFWQAPSESFNGAVESFEIDVCKRLLSSTRYFPIDSLVLIMKTHKQTINKALCSDNKAMHHLFLQWLEHLPQSYQAEVLSQLSIFSISVILEQEQMSLIDAMPLTEQAQVLNCRDDFGRNLFHLAFDRQHQYLEKLTHRLAAFSASQLAMILSQTDGKSSLLHIIAIKEPKLLHMCFNKIKSLSSSVLLKLLLCRNEQNNTVFELVNHDVELYKYLLNGYNFLSLDEQILLFSQVSGRERTNLLQKAPSAVKIVLLDHFKNLPQSAQIEILTSMSRQSGNGLTAFMNNNRAFRLMFLNMIKDFPVYSQGQLCLAGIDSDNDLLYTLLNVGNDELKLSVIDILSGLSKIDAATFFMKKRQGKGGDHALQNLAKAPKTASAQKLLDNAFRLFFSLPVDTKVDILCQKNNEGNSLLADIVIHKHYESFEKLCKSLSDFSDVDKVSVLYRSGYVPTHPTTLWVSTLYGSPTNVRFLKLLDNKAFYKPMLHLLKSLPPKTQITILTNRMSNGAILLNKVGKNERPELEFVLKQAKAMLHARELLSQMADTIANEDINSPKAELHRILCAQLDDFQNTYNKSYHSIHDLAKGWQHAIEAYMPNFEGELTCLNIFVGLLKLVAAVLMPLYGAYLLHEKVSTNRNVLFKTDDQNLIYKLEDTINAIESTFEKQLDLNR